MKRFRRMYELTGFRTKKDGRIFIRLKRTDFAGERITGEWTTEWDFKIPLSWEERIRKELEEKIIPQGQWDEEETKVYEKIENYIHEIWEEYYGEKLQEIIREKEEGKLFKVDWWKYPILRRVWVFGDRIFVVFYVDKTCRGNQYAYCAWFFTTKDEFILDPGEYRYMVGHVIGKKGRNIREISEIIEGKTGKRIRIKVNV